MSPFDVLTALKQKGLMPPEQADALADYERTKPLSLHYELRAMLSVGILLLTGGLGLLIYEHYEEIGDVAILGSITALCVASFVFAWRFRPALSAAKVSSRSVFGDYALLLGCLLFLSLEGYAQYRFNLFGTRYGLATFLPAVLFVALAYRFDHQGVLTIGLTALASWVGVTVRPLELRLRTNFFDEPTVWAAVGLGLVLIAMAAVGHRQRVKAHFTHTLLAFGGNLLLIALLAGVFNFEGKRLLYGLLLLVACVGFDQYARRDRSFLFMLMGVVYGDIGLTYLLGDAVDGMALPPEVYMLYFTLASVGAALYLITNYRKLSRDETL
ncbi:DUF2157 domain-containing protein [Fibrella sp. HMF5335]|uniref:DUF2157 domain-containing protein n=1 Tax=Fibrella rubiginis TaxID=2817060 RepID=A0A939K4B6_9BACT|nr:DUF2157 domain-containing protein [Fibrella rubiginis]MBO0936533.1 DUF2157 domain-containing protein [Fibrella rubiginis]